MKFPTNFPIHMRVSGMYRVDSNGRLPVEIKPAVGSRGVELRFKTALSSIDGDEGEFDTVKLTLPHLRGATQVSNTPKPTVELTYFRLLTGDDKARFVRDAIRQANIGYGAEVRRNTLLITPLE